VIEIENIDPNNPTLIGDTFNNYFIEIGQSLVSKISPSPIPYTDYLQNVCEATLTFSQVTEREVKAIIKNSKDSSPGHDDLPMAIIKQAEFILTPLITHLCNLSLTSGIVPHFMKTAKVIPVHKSGPTNQTNNYRPISILPSLSKILEKITYNRLIEFMNENNILSDSQFGFRSQRSTETALQRFIDHVLGAFDKNQFTLSVFLDLSKAFDTVNHAILLNKLCHYGIRGIPLKWLTSYLSNRQQYVYVNNQSSSRRKVSCGVPQGSILGPLLFLVCINDLPNSNTELNTILFADDSTLFCSHDDIYSLTSTVNNHLSDVASWLKANKLTLNVAKTHYMIFHRHKKFTYPVPPLTLNNSVLTETSQTKFLGVTIQQQLYWHNHIQEI
ncbi:MAG: reverse transcriptase family protein, partial [Cyanobacteria bacterium J06553_1]